MDVVVSQLDGGLELSTYQTLGFFHLLVADGQCGQIDMVELQFIALHGIIATFLDISQHRGYRIVEFRHVEMGALHNSGPFASFRKPYDIH